MPEFCKGQTCYRTVISGRTCCTPGAYLTSNSISAPSNALPRFLRLWTNAKKPWDRGVALGKWLDAGEANSVKATRTLLSYLHGLQKGFAIFISGVLARAMVDTLRVLCPGRRSDINAVLICTNMCVWNDGVFVEGLDCLFAAHWLSA